MTAAKQKSKKTALEPIESEASVENEINTKGSKKSSAEKSSVTREATEVEAFENDSKAAVKKIKTAKVKVIRDSFSFPEKDYLKISELKSTCLAAGIHVKKGELLRAGLHLLTKLNLDELKQAVEQVEKVQTGRPSAEKI
jgi:hypothetical protein